MSTIKFDHTQNSFPKALGLDENDIDQLARTNATMMQHVVEHKPSRSEIAEMIAKTFSFTEIIMLATDGFHAKLEEALTEFKSLVDDVDLSKINSTEELQDALRSKLSTWKPGGSIQKLEIDPTDVDGSLNRAGIPDDLKAELKARILEEMKNRIKDQEE